MPRATVALVALLAACGSKTALEVGTPPRHDGGTPFDTFPCRWSWGLPYEVALGPETDAPVDFARLRGAVNGRRDEVVVLANDGERVVGARLALASPPLFISAEDDGGAIAVGGHLDGWSTLDATCRVSIRDLDFDIVSEVTVADPSATCAYAPVDPRYIDVVERERDGLTPHRYDEHGAPIEDRTYALGTTPTIADEQAVRGPGRALLWTWRDGTEIRMVGGATGSAAIDGAVGFALTDDTLRPAGLFAVAMAAGGLRFVRAPFDDPADLEQLGSTDRRWNEPLSVVTNETEALVPLEDGSIAIQPLSGSAFRTLAPPEPGSISSMRIVMRDGASLGGALYTIREGRRTALRFAPLTCNR